MKNYKSAFLADLDQLCLHRSYREVITDFCRIVADRIDPVASTQTAALEYLKAAIKKYSEKDLVLFDSLFAHLKAALDSEYHDFLGSCLMELDMGNDRLGQYFTPDSLAQLKAEILTSAGYPDIEKHGFMVWVEPAVGAGGLMIGVGRKLAEDGYNPSAQLFVCCTDNDPLAADMAYIQFSLLGIPAEVNTGDTLRLEMRRTRYTLPYYLNQFEDRIRFRNLFEAMHPHCR